MSSFVRLQVADGVGTITLDRPPMNAFDAKMQDELLAAADAAAADPLVRSVVIFGGSKVFAAGADIKEMAAMSHEDMVTRSVALQAAFTSVAMIPKPVIAAITGYALGGGCELALAADFRICADNAKLGQPEIQLGIIPGAGGTQRLPRLIGPARAKDLIFSGRLVDAAEALVIGLVDEVVAATEVYERARARALRLAAGPQLALRAAKEAIERGMATDLATGLELERIQFASLFATQDRAKGMSSFLTEGPGKAVFD